MLVSTEFGVVMDSGIGVVIFIFGGVCVCAVAALDVSKPAMANAPRYLTNFIRSPFYRPITHCAAAELVSPTELVAPLGQSTRRPGLLSSASKDACTLRRVPRARGANWILCLCRANRAESPASNRRLDRASGSVASAS